MNLKIYIFRHGQTYYNKYHIFTGWKDSKLTPRGIRDAKAVAKKLKDKKFQVAYHTRLSRSKDTLKHVLKYHPECHSILYDDRMIERSYGNLQGMRHSTYIKREGLDSYNTLMKKGKLEPMTRKEKRDFIYKVGKAEFDVVHRSYNTPPPGGESIRDVEARVKPFIKDLLKMMKKQKVNVAISAHGNSMRPFIRYFKGLTVKEMMKLEIPWDEYYEYNVKI